MEYVYYMFNAQKYSKYTKESIQYWIMHGLIPGLDTSPLKYTKYIIY